jgi:hypothetical protein
MTKELTAKNPTATAGRNIPAITPKAQPAGGGAYWQSQGQAWREAYIILPEGLVAQDLTDHPHDVWKLIQQNPPFAPRRLDRVCCVSADGTWMLEARVGFADLTRVVLTKPTVTQLPEPKDAGLYSDEMYAVEPFPGGYAIMNKKSGARLGNTVYGTPDQAKAAVMQQYPTRAA